MANFSDPSFAHFFDAKTMKLNWPKRTNNRKSVRLVHKISSLEKLIPDKSFRDLIYRLIDVSPNRRIEPLEALKLPVLN